MPDERILECVRLDLGEEGRLTRVSSRFGTRRLDLLGGPVKLRLFSSIRRGRSSTQTHQELWRAGAWLPEVLATGEHGGWFFKYAAWVQGRPVRGPADVFSFGESLARLANLGGANDDYKRANLVVAADGRVIQVDCENLGRFDDPEERIAFCIRRQRWLSPPHVRERLVAGYATLRPAAGLCRRLGPGGTE